MALVTSGEPSAPDIGLKMLLCQFKVDVYGKEVQSAATYSYMWMADQMGHVCLGILINFGISWLAGFVFNESWSDAIGLLLGAVAVSLWEVSAYRSDVKNATGTFPLDKKTLGANAFIAAAYMVFGVVIGFGFHLGFRISGWWGVGLFVAMAVAGTICAPPWLRQKITWQKAALPYLFRLADAKRTITDKAAAALQALIDGGAPPAATAPPRQVVVSGPIGSGRTPLATGIGTEFAFKKCKARYLSFDSLLEFAAASKPPAFGDDSGPSNVNYWPWSEAQVVIIDDIGPTIGSQHEQGDFEHFRALLAKNLEPIAATLAKRHTVWVIGDMTVGLTSISARLDRYAAAIRDFCQGKQEPLVIELEMEQTPEGTQGVAKVRSGY